MVTAISGIGHNNYMDYEYMQIIMELHRLGITPCGNKQADKARLQAEKAKIVKQIKLKAESAQRPEKNQLTDEKEKTELLEKAQLEEERLGAKTIAELNKILHGLT